QRRCQQRKMRKEVAGTSAKDENQSSGTTLPGQAHTHHKMRVSAEPGPRGHSLCASPLDPGSHPGSRPGLRPGSVVEERDRKQLPSELFIKIAPLRISLLDQCKIPLTPPAYDAQLTLVRRSDRLMRFKPHKPSDAILAGEAAKHAFAMLIHPPEQITR